MLAPLVALLLAAAPDTVWGAIRGTVQSDPGGTPLASAVVEATSGGQTLTDSTGAYLLSHVAVGRQLVRVRSLDHEPFELEVFVPANGSVVVDVALRHRPLALDTVAGVGAGQGGAAGDAAPRGVAAVTDFTAFEGPGGMDAAGQGGAGATTGGGDGDVLLVRGSAADLKLVLLDGAPVYAPFHMAGLIESFEPELLSGARLYLGGAPARYDGGVSYILDLATRSADPDRWSSTAAADLVAARGEADGPLWRGAGLLVATRAIHGGTLEHLQGQPFPYEYADGLARADISLGGGATLSLTGFANGEGVRTDTVPGRDNFLRWSNQAVSTRLRGPVTGARGELTVAVSEFHARLPDAAAGLRVLAAIERVRVALDFTRDLGNLRLAYGYAYDRQAAHHRVIDRRDGERLWFARDTFGTVGGWYVDGLWSAGKQWLLRGGLRGDMYAGGSFISFSPRLAVTWLPTTHAALTLAAGRYHQLVLSRNPRPFDYGNIDVADSLGIPTVPVVASGNHLTLSLDQELTRGVRLGLEGYYKRFEDIPEPDRVGTYASGVDVWVRRGEGGLNGWMGYSLAWYWSTPDSVGQTVRFSGRQILSAGVAAQGRAGRVGLRVAYGAGLPYSAVGAPLGDLPPAGPVTGSDESAGPLTGADPQDFLRVDGELSRTFTPRLRGHPTQLTPYVRLLNALDRRDALFYRWRPSGGLEPSPAATLPVLPIFGLEWRI